jgi:chitin-binding protein
MNVLKRAKVRRRTLPLLGAFVAITAAGLALITFGLTRPADAHGATVGPPARHFGCWDRYADDWQGTETNWQANDPMCAQAWEAEPSAMWNWNGLLVDGLNGAYIDGIPDGQICSAGQTSDGRYNALDVPGPWYATAIPSSSEFTVELHDQAIHGADFLWVYVTSNEYDPATDLLTWGDLTRYAEAGPFAAGSGTPGNGEGYRTGESHFVDVSAPGLTGRHVVLLVWKASHADQTYYLCSDVDFGGPGGVPGSTTTTTTAPVTSTTSGPTTTEPPTTSTTSGPTTTEPPTATTDPGGFEACTVDYQVASSWPGGYQGAIEITNNGDPLSSWELEFQLDDDQIDQGWTGQFSQSGDTVTVANETWNAQLGTGEAVTLGFIGSSTGAIDTPDSFTVNGTPCATSTS